VAAHHRGRVGAPPIDAADHLTTPLAGVLSPRQAERITEATGCRTVEELLRHLPRRYAERGELTDLGALHPGQPATVLAEVASATLFTPRGRGQRGRVTVTLTDGAQTVTATFFHRAAWHHTRLQPGTRALLAGRVGTYRGRLQLAHPEYVLLDAGPGHDDGEGEAEPAFAGRLLPIYPARGGEPSWRIGRAIVEVLDRTAALLGPGWGEAVDPLTGQERGRCGLLALGAAYEAVHRPDSRAQADAGRRRLAFEEALVLQLALAQRRVEVRSAHAVARVPAPDGLLTAFDGRLGFPLTAAQRRAGEEILADLASGHPMHRLLQGDVGSGKTLVALRAMLAVVDAGGQAALLAPTEVLAAQHERSLRTMLGPLADRGLLGGHAQATRVALLTGSVPVGQRRRLLADLLTGEIGIVVGTHALLEERVQFADLGLVVVDEQHRFGVAQRSRLAERGQAGTRPHVLVMTATPIPRTVAMTVFGDLDLTVLDELPPGRAGVATHWVNPVAQPLSAQRVWERAREEIAGGGKVYVVAPRIGDPHRPPTAAREPWEDPGDEVPDRDEDAGGPGDDEAAEADPGTVLALHARLVAGELAAQRVGLLHGRLSAEEKDACMRRFGLPATDPEAFDALVATTVIEVGVDIPEATMIVLTNAERFGISQLHQLRGRIGRGGRPGVCILVSEAAPDTPAGDRLAAVTGTTDGFALAEADVRTRREGDVLGTRQSGWRSGLRLLRVLRDRELIGEARDLAGDLLAADPGLAGHPTLAQRVARVLADARSENLARS